MKTKVLLAVLCLSGMCLAQSYTYSTLIQFQGGTNPFLISNLIIDSKGNLYGVSEYGGKYGNGTVFKVSPSGALTILHSFKGAPSDGYLATGSLTRDKSGNFYGTTSAGGTCSYCGIIFKLTPAGKETVLYNFTGGSDGYDPVGGLVRDPSGNLFGISHQNVSNGYNSLLFKLTSTSSFSVLSTFDCFLGGDNLLIRNSAGDLFGVGCNDTATPNGSLFEMTPTNQLENLYTFTGGSDGANPFGKLSQDAKGNLYGVAASNGAHGAGVLYKIDSAGAYSVLYDFCSQANCADGSNPNSWITVDSAGNLYGSTLTGGTSGNGLVFEISPSGVETVLYNFTDSTQNPTNQETGFVMDSAGNLFASIYGSNSIYKLTKP